MGSDFDYQNEVQKMLLTMQGLASLDVESILKTIERLHSIGPFIDPTSYRDALYRGDMDSIEKMAHALQEPIKIFNERIRPRMGVSLFNGY